MDRSTVAKVGLVAERVRAGRGTACRMDGWVGVAAGWEQLFVRKVDGACELAVCGFGPRARMRSLGVSDAPELAEFLEAAERRVDAALDEVLLALDTMPEQPEQPEPPPARRSGWRLPGFR